MDEKKLDAMLKDMTAELPNEDPDGKELEQQINRRLKAIAVRTVLSVLAGILGLLLVVSPLVGLFCYNPLKKQKALIGDTDNELAQYMRAYASVFLPYRSVYGTQVKNKGFGVYEVTLMMPEPAVGKAVLWSSEMEVVYEVRWGRWYGQKNTDRFQAPVNRLQMMKETETILPELTLLPDSCLIYCTLALETPAEPQELYREEINLHWLQVEQNANDVQAGISLDYFQSTQTDRSGMNGAQLKEEFLADLDILLSDRELLTAHGIYVSRGIGEEAAGGILMYPGTLLEEVRDDVAAQEAVRTRIVSVSGRKQDLLRYLEEVGAVFIDVDYVLLSSWSR